VCNVSTAPLWQPTATLPPAQLTLLGFGEGGSLLGAVLERCSVAGVGQVKESLFAINFSPPIPVSNKMHYEPNHSKTPTKQPQYYHSTTTVQPQYYLMMMMFSIVLSGTTVTTSCNCHSIGGVGALDVNARDRTACVLERATGSQRVSQLFVNFCKLFVTFCRVRVFPKRRSARACQ
jgi:hypothetical protein